MERAKYYNTGFFDVIMEKQTYLNIIYLILAFPLGLFYVVFLCTGFAAGFMTIPIFIGVPALFLTITGAKYMMKFERKLALVFLGMKLYEPKAVREKGKGILIRFKEELLGIETWKTILYLSCKFISGSLIFFGGVTLGGISLCLTMAPLLYQLAVQEMLTVDGAYFDGVLKYIGIIATPEQEAVILMVTGIFLLFGSLHLFNGIAYLSGRFLEAMSPINSDEKDCAKE
ncbi:MAG: sensor domain-containing protein [Caulobacteraceae bacterium]